MQNLNFQNILKKIFSNKTLIYIFLVNLFSFVVILGLLAFLIWNYRGDIFKYFAQDYIREQVALNATNNANSSDILNENDLLGSIVQDLNTQPIQSAPVQSQEDMVVAVVEKTNPAVVSIVISREVPVYETYIEQNQNPFGDLFPNFNFNIPQYRQKGTEKKDIGGGSGFLVTNDGLIVTNRHVVDLTGVEFRVFTNDGKEYQATVLAKDPVLDIAFIKITGKNFPYLTIGNSDNLQVGHTVIAIGNALAEFKNTVSVGVISGLSRSLTAGDNSGKTEFLDHVIQTDAAINPGNSGGPLLNLRGEVIGVNVAMAQGSQSIGFALPINSVKSAIDSVKKTGKIVRPYLGVRYVVIDKAMQQANSLAVDYGVLVKAGANANELAVLPGSPADKAGIVENDIILFVDGVKLTAETNLASIIRTKKVGQRVALRVLSKGVEKNVYVTLESAND